jgi:hypothetical protein
MVEVAGARGANLRRLAPLDTRAAAPLCTTNLYSWYLHGVM